MVSPFSLINSNPLAVPHAVVEDDVYEGFHIPKGEFPGIAEYPLNLPAGAMLISNLWSVRSTFLRTRSCRPVFPGRWRATNPSAPNPHTFIPERFLNDDGSLRPNDIEHIAYGFGRCMCVVGRHFADTSVWSLMVRLLAIFKILGPLDENGAEIPVEPKFLGGNAV